MQIYTSHCCDRETTVASYAPKYANKQSSSKNDHFVRFHDIRVNATLKETVSELVNIT